MRILSLLFISLFHLFCQHKPEDPPPLMLGDTIEINILALGDSYTKGQSVTWESNFPNQLADSLMAEGRKVLRPNVIAQTGWRTDNLQAAIANQSDEIGDSIFSLVTLCIGVNNQYQNADFEVYKIQFEQLLQTAIARAGGKKNRVIVLSIPDWAFTPYGQGFSDPSSISQKIDAYNEANQTISTAYGVHYVNVTAISRRGLSEPNLVAFDGLHPSAEQYSAWVQALLPVARKALEN